MTWPYVLSCYLFMLLIENAEGWKEVQGKQTSHNGGSGHSVSLHHALCLAAVAYTHYEN